MTAVTDSPIILTLETWPLAGRFRLAWGSDESGQLWVAVQNADGECRGVLPYKDYLERAAGPHAETGRND